MKKYVEEYKGHKVPEGSQYYFPEDVVLSEGWGRVDKASGDVEFVFLKNDNNWEKIPRLPDNAIELPEAAKEAEWEPTVGEECRIAESTEWLKISHEPGMIVKIYPSFVADSGATLFPFLSAGLNKVGGVATAECFCPLKSAKELEREAFVTAFIQASGPFTSSYNVAVSLFDAGFTAPKE
jgi:hypothetical protein